MNILKKYIPDAIAVVLFLLISFAYFFTPVSQGLVLSGHDNTAGIGANHELAQYEERTGETTRWTNALFSGMPTYQLSPTYGSRSALATISHIYELGISNVMMYTFIFMLGFYILLRAFNFKVWMAVLGAVVWAFSSYFFIIIAAGHIWKVLTLAFIPPTIAGMILCYRGKYLWGGVVSALFVALQILSNHLQMSYYFLFLMFFMAVGYFFQALKEKQLPRFFKGTAVLVVAWIIGSLANLSSLYHTYEYSKETMRSKSELVKASNSEGHQSGLGREYITQWSYGVGETWSLLVPNVKGGASVPLAGNETAMKKADPQYYQLYQQIGQYWGEQPGTSGPVYVGAFVLLLFIFGLFIVKGGLKWSLLIGTVFSFFMAWGHNFMPFTDFMIDYMPMYNKFRAVSSALVVAEFTIPLLAMLALAEIIKRPEILKKKQKFLYVSFALTGGAALCFALMPSLFFSNYVSANEMSALQQNVPGEVLGSIVQNLTDVRQAVFTADAWRSFWIVTVGFALLMAYRYRKIQALPMVALLLVLCLFDMWQVNKRYLNDEVFVDPWLAEKPFAKTPADEEILKDKSLDYRVLNLSTNTFNENNTSYWHKSVGGYHAAKLARYQDLINECLQPEISALGSAVAKANGDMALVNGDSIFPVLNMLNTKYFIFPLGGGQTIPITNPYANGCAWFVPSVQYVNGASEEMAALKKINTKQVAVVDASFKSLLGDVPAGQPIDSIAVVKMVSYEPNELTYEVKADKGGVLVFSEIYYPGWEATIDGNPVEIVRANYILRAIKMPAGTHKVVMTFKPASISVTEGIAYGALIIILIAFIAALLISIRKGKEV